MRITAHPLLLVKTGIEHQYEQALHGHVGMKEIETNAPWTYRKAPSSDSIYLWQRLIS